MSRAAERERRLLKRYNLTLEQYHKLLEAQHNRCKGCGKTFNEDTRLPHVDHDHTTGLVRGLLCFYCNQEIGTHHDDGDWFRNIADYLASPIAQDVLGNIYVPGSPGAEGVLT